MVADLFPPFFTQKVSFYSKDFSSGTLATEGLRTEQKGVKRPVPAGRGWDALARPRCTRLEERMEMYWPGEASLDLKEDDFAQDAVWRRREGVFPASSNQATLEERVQLTGQCCFEGTGSCHPGKIRQTTWISQKSLY